MTTCDSLIMNIVSEPYAGKPHVRFDEEGGKPTLTLRYVDGMGLYNGYSVPGGLDPWGGDTFDYEDPDRRAGRLGPGTSTGMSVATVYVEAEFDGVCGCSGEPSVVIKVTINVHGLAGGLGGSQPWGWSTWRTMGSVNFGGGGQ